jgi:hypothetical protein
MERNGVRDGMNRKNGAAATRKRHIRYSVFILREKQYPV